MRGNTAGVVLGILFILLGVGFPATYWLWLTNTRLLIGRGMVGYQDLFGRRRLWSTSEVARLVQITIVYHSFRSGDQPKQAVLLIGADGSCLQRVRSANWTQDAIDAFTTAAGSTLADMGSYTTSEAARMYPGSVGLMYAHPRGAVWATLGIVAVVGGLIEVLLLTR